MKHKTKTVPVHDIFLDNGNPRHEEIDNESEIIKELVNAEGVDNLADDIADWGLSPLDRMAVIPHETERGKYIVAEGNRRLCAIKLLVDPDKAPTEDARTVFRALRKKPEAKISDLEVVIFPDRAAARHWLELRHEGPLEGRGTKPWNPAQKTRWKSKGKGENENALALEVLDYAQGRELITEAQRERLSLTTLTRFLKSPVVRDALGLTSHKPPLTTRATQRDFDKAILHFLRDALKAESPVHSRTNRTEREAYASVLRRTGVSPKPESEQPREIDTATGAMRSTAAGAPSPKPSKKRDSPNSRNRPHVIPSSFTITVADPILKRVYRELKTIPTDDYLFATSALFRGFIEISTRRYCTKHGITYNERNLAATLSLVETDLNAKGVKAHITKGLRTLATSADSGFSPESIGSSLHGNNVTLRRELNDGWDKVVAGLHEILIRL